MNPRTLPLTILLLSFKVMLPAQAPPAPGPAESPFLGLQTELKDARDPKSGVVVAYVWPLSAAKEMGFQISDEIRTLNDVLITSPEDFSREVRKENVNAKLRFRILRAGQEVKIEGRIGSREKTMKAYEDQLRKEMVGKPLPAFPGLVWWSPTTKKWEEKADALAAAKGKIAVYMSFDDCPVCKEKRYQRLTQMQTLLSKTTGDQVAYFGVFFDERPGKSGKEACIKTATELVTGSPPSVPIAVASYPNDKPTAAERDKQALLHNHGTAIVGLNGNVEFVQVVGVPEQDFGDAFRKALLALQAKQSAEKPEDKKAGEPKPSSP